VIDRISRSAAAAAYRRYRWSTSARAVSTVVAVLAGYVLLHQRFARFDAAIARHVLGAMGLHVASAGPSGLTVSAGTRFDVTAIVTGSCSSAAGVLGLCAVTIVLLHGRLLRRAVGGLAAAALFVLFNQLRICSILLLGWWLAVASKPVVLATLVGIALAAVPTLVLPHRRLLLRVASFLVAGLCGTLAYQVAHGDDYLHGMISYHALAGPMLTFTTLALGILFVWRVIVGRDDVALQPT